MNIIADEKLYENTLIIKKSKFICKIKSISSEKEALDFLQTHSASDATHNCYVYIIDNIIRKSDDGEPTNTAAKPMLEILKHRNLTNVICLVTRYFGGVKLGAGGLIRAYANAVKTTLEDIKIIPYEKKITIKLSCSLDKSKQFNYIIKKYNLDTNNVSFTNLKCEGTWKIKESIFINLVNDLKASQINFEVF